ncbi:ferrous iron transport protein B [Thermoanaerobacterium sp. RBIITD]|uniref:ferrous iron transport protein B n=1 Tax=Thermoanaerobacterium sp. RBIITD TaxID=1550240 RepID=UPI000BB7FDE7|nr:ferrous iron transport protein B [Thermoanaerobacterium sp. RBIITD]SNX55327.1 ferrous iron transport protein B [Thermoanaerobacterium sp. RBIITD]
MSNCCTELKIDVPKGAKKIVLVGNPNVGKSVFFNSLTGMYVDVSNFPGTTVDISHGKFGNDVVIDTPGVYGVSSFNDEERVARDVILDADIVLNVVDALHIERDLFLTQQLIDMGKPLIIALNMMDEVKRNGISIDVKRLEMELGVTVIPCIATKNMGVKEVKNNIYNAKYGNRTNVVKKYYNEFKFDVPNKSEILLILEDDENVMKRNGIKEKIGLREIIYNERRKRVNEIINNVIKEENNGASFNIKLGRMMLKPITGIPLLIITLGIMYEVIGVIIAQTVVGFTEGEIMDGIYKPFIVKLIGSIIPIKSFFGSILIGEFGLLTMTVIYVIGLLLPLVIGFYFFLSLLEDSGYLPRIAALVDRVLTGLGLNGKAIIPMILGLGCVTMATITTRILGSRRERFIATMLLGLAIPCSAQLAVIASMIAPLGLSYILAYSGILIVIFLAIGKILNKVLPGKSSDLLIDLPTLKMPEAKNVIKKTLSKTKMFLEDAVPLFAIGSLIIAILQYTGILDIIQRLASPLTTVWLKLPKQAANAFIMGFVRRDFGAAGLYSLNLSPKQTLVALVTITLFVPCIAATMVIFKERGKNESLIIWFGSVFLAFLVGGTLAQIINII